MTMFTFLQSATFDPYFASQYELIRLPPLSAGGTWGIFQEPPNPNDDNTMPDMNYVNVKKLFYSPQSHAGVQDFINALKIKYPDVEPEGADSVSDIDSIYEENLFTTWAAIQFDLTSDQLSSGSFFTTDGSVSNVKFTFRVSPSEAILPDYEYDDLVYRDSVAQADWWYKAGYMTMQNFVSTYMTQKITNDATFTIDGFIQRYPYDMTQEEAPGIDWAFLRMVLWKWMGSVILTASCFLPILMVVIQPVKERASKMVDLLQISGMLNSAYYASYIIGAFLIFMFMATICLFLLFYGLVLSKYHIDPYFSLVNSFIFLLFLFLIPII